MGKVRIIYLPTAEIVGYGKSNRKAFFMTKEHAIKFIKTNDCIIPASGNPYFPGKTKSIVYLTSSIIPKHLLEVIEVPNV